jgi:hypothetical protein
MLRIILISGRLAESNTPLGTDLGVSNIPCPITAIFVFTPGDLEPRRDTKSELLEGGIESGDGFP